MDERWVLHAFGSRTAQVASRVRVIAGRDLVLEKKDMEF